MSEAVVRLIFTNCYQDGENHYSQIWSTTDVPVPDDIASQIKHKIFKRLESLAGSEIIIEPPTEETP